MRKFKVLACVALVMLATGFMDFNNYEEQVYTVRLRAGQTVECVAEDYYTRNENGECYDAWRYRVLEKNRSLFADGRVPQINDMVIIPVMVRK